MLAIWQQAFWLRFENSIHCVKRIFRGKTNFWRKCFLFTHGASWARSQGFQSVVLLVCQDILRKESLKKYSDVYFSWNKKNWDVWQKNFVEFWNVDDMCREILSEETLLFEVKCLVFYLWRMLSIQLPIFRASQMGKLSGQLSSK